MGYYTDSSGAIRILADTIDTIEKNKHDDIYRKTKVYNGTYLGGGLVSCGGKTYPCKQVTDMFCNAGSSVYCQLVNNSYAIIIGG